MNEMNGMNLRGGDTKKKWDFEEIVTVMVTGFMARLSRWGLSLLGFGIAVSCRVEYGSPYTTFQVSGKVTDENNVPVQNIEVSTMETMNKTVTGKDGSFAIEGTNSLHFEQVEIFFTDTDGEENGGDFRTTSRIVHLTKTEEPGKKDDSWYQGKYEGSVDVVLETAGGTSGEMK